MKPTTFELFAAFAAQLPLLTREDLESTVADLRQRPGWQRAIVHARLQAIAIGLREDDLDPEDDIARAGYSNEEMVVGTA
jgi:hypothetical protein